MTLIAAVRGLGYVCAADWNGSYRDERILLLRHDVDFSLDAAVMLARAEAKMGIKATYFVRPDSAMYNPRSSMERRRIAELAALGHEVAAHCDYRTEDGLRGIFRQIEVLADVHPGTRADLISFHRPAARIDRLRQLRVPGVTHTYEGRFFGDGRYLSDSNCSWGRSADGWVRQAERGASPLQLLLHPVWWTCPGRTGSDRLQWMLRRRMEDLSSVSSQGE